MKTQHTPGPWFIDSFAQIGDEKSIIGRVYCGDIFPNDDLPECTANARLIAAAPELLEALEGLSDILNNHYGDDDDETPAIDKAFDAIRKAKGL